MFKNTWQIIAVVLLVVGLGSLPYVYKLSTDNVSTNYNIVEHRATNFLFKRPRGGAHTLFLPGKESRGLSTSMAIFIVNLQKVDYLAYAVFVDRINFEHDMLELDLVVEGGKIDTINLHKHFIPGTIPKSIVSDPAYKNSKLRMSKLFEKYTHFNPRRTSSLVFFATHVDSLMHIKNAGIDAYEIMISGEKYTFRLKNSEKNLVLDLLRHLHLDK